MSKDKKEFKRRVAKIRKHVDSLQALLMGKAFKGRTQTEQKEIGETLNELEDLSAQLAMRCETSFPAEEGSQRKDPRSIAN